MSYQNTDNYNGMESANQTLFDTAVSALQSVQDAVKGTPDGFNFQALLESLGEEPRHTLNME